MKHRLDRARESSTKQGEWEAVQAGWTRREVLAGAVVVGAVAAVGAASLAQRAALIGAPTAADPSLAEASAPPSEDALLAAVRAAELPGAWCARDHVAHEEG